MKILFLIFLVTFNMTLFGISSKAVVIIDMQDEFEASEKIKKEVIQVIKTALKNETPIILVKYKGFGPIMDEITDLFPDPDLVTVIKNDSDGSDDIIDYFGQNNISPEIIQICGLNTNECVKRTVRGLKQHLPQQFFEIIENACADISDEAHNKGLRKIKRDIPNCRFIRNDNA